MKLLYTVCCLFIFTLAQSQHFYDLNTIQTIEITFAQSNWDQLLDAEKLGDENYVMAQSITINGEVFDSIGVKYKGNSTYNPNQVKNPLHIELDTYKDHIYQDYTDLKLSNVAKDPSFLREVLSYQILRKYMDAPLSNYANVYVNGTLIGLYSNSESVSKKFVKSRFGSNDNTFVKCNPPAGAGPQTNDFPNLVYLGQDSSSYIDAYELKSETGWDELIHLCDTLKNDVDAIENILDIDRSLWMLAFNNVLVNLDSYTGGFTQNYYLYRDDYGRFIPIVWDLNESFGKFSNSGAGNLNSTQAKQQMSNLLHSTDSDFPLIQQLLNVPTYKRMYLAHCKTMLLENFENDSYYTTGLEFQSLINDAVQDDDNKFFSYNNFINNLTSDVNSGGGPGGGNTPGISNLMDGRNTFLLGQSDFTASEPDISNLELSNAEPVLNEEIILKASIANAQSAQIRYRFQDGGPFASIEMFDDGAHNDGNANDGVYAASLSMIGSTLEYFIYAENDQIGKFSPVRAEHEFYFVEVKIINIPAGDIVINEFMASNDFTVSDQDGEYDDWIELYNNTGQSIDLSGYFLSDNVENLAKWEFPDGTIISGNEYIIVWADEDQEQSGLHGNFKLSASGEQIFLVNPENEIIDQIDFDEQVTDISFGRFPNGTGDFQSMNPTFQEENNLSTSTINSQNSSTPLKLYPNPTNDYFMVDLEGQTLDTPNVMIYDLNGKIHFQETYTPHSKIDVSMLNAGVYIVQVGATFAKIAIFN